MKIDNNFIQLISHKDTLNKEQFKILGLDYPSEENWKNQALDKEVSKNDMNLPFNFFLNSFFNMTLM